MSTSPAITMTQAAAKKVYQLMQEEQNLNLNLRVYITGGGCSGFQYGFTFDEVINEDEDTVITTEITEEEDDEGGTAVATKAVVRLLVDYASLQYLRDAEIDYSKTMEGEQFIIRNPNAKTTCGCGSSFSA
jgi:iron-sulfur cluster insertion protein